MCNIWDLLIHSSENISAQDITKLIDRGFLEYAENEQKISLHPVIKGEILRTLPVRFSNVLTFVRAFCRRMENFWHFDSREKQRCGLYALVMLQTLGMPEAPQRPYAFLLADLLWQAGYWKEAENYTQKLYDSCRKKEGICHPDTARAASLAGAVYHNQGRRREAADWYGRCWESYEGLKEKDPFFEAQYRYKYARFLKFYGKQEEAVRQLEEAERIYKKEMEDGNRPDEMKSWLINLYIERTRTELEAGNADIAQHWQEKAQELSACGYGGGATRAFILHDRGKIFSIKGEKTTARICLMQAKELAKNSLGEKSREYGEILLDIRRLRTM